MSVCSITCDVPFQTQLSQSTWSNRYSVLSRIYVVMYQQLRIPSQQAWAALTPTKTRSGRNSYHPVHLLNAGNYHINLAHKFDRKGSPITNLWLHWTILSQDTSLSRECPYPPQLGFCGRSQQWKSNTWLFSICSGSSHLLVTVSQTDIVESYFLYLLVHIHSTLISCNMYCTESQGKH